MKLAADEKKQLGQPFTGILSIVAWQKWKLVTAILASLPQSLLEPLNLRKM